MLEAKFLESDEGDVPRVPEPGMKDIFGRRTLFGSNLSLPLNSRGACHPARRPPRARCRTGLASTLRPAPTLTYVAPVATLGPLNLSEAAGLLLRLLEGLGVY